MLNVIWKCAWCRRPLWTSTFLYPPYINTLRPGQDDRHFPDDIFKCIFLNENERISMQISLKFVPKGPINNIPVLVQIVAWRRQGAKLLSELMVVRSLTHISVTQHQRVVTHFYVLGPRHNGCHFAYDILNAFMKRKIMCFILINLTKCKLPYFWLSGWI